jgi:hypothetical protein
MLKPIPCITCGIGYHIGADSPFWTKTKDGLQCEGCATGAFNGNNH